MFCPLENPKAYGTPAFLCGNNYLNWRRHTYLKMHISSQEQSLAVPLNQKPIHSGMNAAGTYEYINDFFIES